MEYKAPDRNLLSLKKMNIYVTCNFCRHFKDWREFRRGYTMAKDLSLVASSLV